MTTELYQGLVCLLMAMLCISSYYRGWFEGLSQNDGWMDEANWWRERQLERDREYESVLRQND